MISKAVTGSRLLGNPSPTKIIYNSKQVSKEANKEAANTSIYSALIKLKEIF